MIIINDVIEYIRLEYLLLFGVYDVSYIEFAHFMNYECIHLLRII